MVDLMNLGGTHARERAGERTALQEVVTRFTRFTGNRKVFDSGE
jgi:hypothetical protein